MGDFMVRTLIANAIAEKDIEEAENSDLDKKSEGTTLDGSKKKKMPDAAAHSISKLLKLVDTDTNKATEGEVTPKKE